MYFTGYIAEEKLPEYRGSFQRTGCTFFRTRFAPGAAKILREKGYRIEDFSSSSSQKVFASARFSAGYYKRTRRGDRII